ncbi:MAG TPA: EAL domain-containing protein [Rhodanobacteraceae bacterium]|nr:EAL domain-containing protein [Rhodanobacteraceae bacterium]
MVRRDIRREGTTHGSAWLKLGCALLAIMAAGAARAAPPGATPEHITVVANGDYPPFLFVDGQGRPEGYVVDKWRLFQAHTGIRVDIKPMTWPAAQDAMAAGDADVLEIAYRTPPREARYAFSKPYATVRIAVYVDDRIRGVHDAASLAGFRVGVGQRDACVEWLRAAGITHLVEFPNYRALARAAAAGSPHAFCMVDDAATFYLSRQGALDHFYQAFVIRAPELRYATRKGDTALLQTLQAGMARITPPEQRGLDRRWLDEPFVLQPYLRTIRWISSTALVALVLLGIWLWALRRVLARRTRRLFENEGKLRTLFDASPDAIWAKDGAGVYRECNESTSRLFKIERGQILGSTDEALFGHEFAAQTRALGEDVWRHGEARTCALELAAGDHAARQLEVVTAPLGNPETREHGVLCLARDITDRKRDELRLRLWARVFEHAGIALVIFTAEPRTIVAASPTFAHERGYEPGEMIGMSADQLYPDRLREEWHTRRPQIERTGHMILESEHVARDGRCFPVQLDIAVVSAPDGSADLVLEYAQDISRRKHAEQELRLTSVAFQSQAALMVTDPDGVIRRVNHAFQVLTGFSAMEAIGKSIQILGWNADPRVLRQIRRTDAADGPWRAEQWLHRKGGASKVVRVMVSVIPGENGRPAQYLCSMVDVSSEHEARAEAKHRKFFDALTDLPNRYFLRNQLRSPSRQPQVGTGMLFVIDLDRFKRVNDVHSHDVGDQLLVLVAQRLRYAVRNDGILARLAGGMFALFVPPNEDPATPSRWTVAGWTARIRRAMAEPFRLDGGPQVAMTVGIGSTQVLPDRGSPETVLKEAEIALYQAKADGPGSAREFQPAMQALVRRREKLVDELERAIETNAFELHYQAQVDGDRRIVAAEALLRWQRQGGSWVPPDEFIPLAEEMGLIEPVGDWVLRRACDRLRRWADDAATRRLSLSVNVSAKQFSTPNFVPHALDMVKASGADPTRLKIELTETALVGNLADVRDKLVRLRDHGIRVSLDDFGTGYSSLAYLSRLSVDQLKIDRSFVTHLPEQRQDALVARTIIGMAQGLDIEVVAEGVETDAQWAFLKHHGCDCFQGYLFARPMSAVAFRELVERRHRSETMVAH